METRWLGLLLDVGDMWWDAGEGTDLFVRLPDPGTAGACAPGMTWMVFARSHAMSQDETRLTPHACYISGVSDRQLRHVAEGYGYMRCGLRSIRVFAPWNGEQAGDEDEEPHGATEAEHRVWSAEAASPSISVGMDLGYVLVHITRRPDAPYTWTWGEAGTPPPAISIEDDAVTVMVCGPSTGTTTGEAETAPSPDATEDDEEWFDVVDDLLADVPTLNRYMWWFSHLVLPRARPHLSPEEENALGNRVVRASPALCVAEDQIDGGGAQECSSEDLAELNWGLVNGRTQVYRSWAEAQFPEGWREDIEANPELWLGHHHLLPISAPWNAVVRYDPVDPPYQALYFVAQVAPAIGDLSPNR